ncbi:hypothetical protein BH10PSE2_BH10PSE2_16050 [soil metagenome]
MPNLPILAVSLAIVGSAVGVALAAISVRLPWDPETPRPSESRPRETLSVGASARYVLIALAAAGIGVWAALAGSGWLAIGATAILGWQLLLIAVIDAEHFWLPDILTWPLAATGLVSGALMSRGIPWSHLIGTIVGFGALWAVAWLYRRVRGREGLGGGDPFLFAGAGAWVGWTGLPSVMMTACAVGLGLVLLRLLFRKSVHSDDQMAFGTFLAIGIWLTWLMGMPAV